MNPSPLLPAIPAVNLSPQICLSLANLKLNLKEISYPETPSCDYILNLASAIEDLNILPDGDDRDPEAKGTIQDTCVEGITEKQQGALSEVYSQ
jgi:hypothetical protein